MASMPWAWRLLLALPVVLVATSAVLNGAYPDCGSEGAPACELNWVYEWKDITLFLAFVAGMVVVFAWGLRSLADRSRPRARPAVVLVVALAWAYAAGWAADAMLNDDGCAMYGEETGPQPEWESEFWPARLNCRVPEPGGGTRLVLGDASVFYSVFGFWMAVALLAMVPGRPWPRLLLGVLAFVGSIYGIFFL